MPKLYLNHIGVLNPIPLTMHQPDLASHMAKIPNPKHSTTGNRKMLISICSNTIKIVRIVPMKNEHNPPINLTS